MKEGHISFKFKSENKMDTVKFFGESVSVKELKQLIAGSRNLNLASDLIIYDEKSNEAELSNERRLATNSVVIVERKVGDFQPEPIHVDNMNSKGEVTKCKYCNSLLNNPVKMTCCGNLICKSCNENHLKLNSNKCYFCETFQNKQNNGVLTKGIPSVNNISTYQTKTYGNNYNQPPPVPEDLITILNNSKYFIIKSVNLENITIAREKNQWATTLANQKKLNEAFKTTQNVILIFSVNKSSKFQGFARMETPIMNEQAAFHWKDKESIKLGGSFKIKWLRKSELSFNRISQYKNPLNNMEPIKKSRDTQEIPLNIGKEICSFFDNDDNVTANDIYNESPEVYDENHQYKPVTEPNENQFAHIRQEEEKNKSQENPIYLGLDFFEKEKPANADEELEKLRNLLEDDDEDNKSIEQEQIIENNSGEKNSEINENKQNSITSNEKDESKKDLLKTPITFPNLFPIAPNRKSPMGFPPGQMGGFPPYNYMAYWMQYMNQMNYMGYPGQNEDKNDDKKESNSRNREKDRDRKYDRDRHKDRHREKRRDSSRDRSKRRRSRSRSRSSHSKSRSRSKRR